MLFILTMHFMRDSFLFNINMLVMGQYLCIGLKTRLKANKEEMGKTAEKIAEAKSFLENNYIYTGLYDLEETDKEYIYTLKEEIMKWEFIPFLKAFYRIRYDETGSSCNNDYVIKELLQHSTVEEWMRIAQEKRYESYQIDSHIGVVRMESFNNRFYVTVENLILSIDGKILMECYDDLFRFFTCCVKKRLEAFKLSDAILVYISD